ncbi:PEPxxWA-CTERM sorting domain-containing protein [Sphingomonas sp. 1P06PA]|uniref:PEPxxWA-CTERM sorting domain-containing protein n=1 Tax=Sphingomonas sp. 1P06PA TaxID=554121 RepID=UPI0039A586EE
MRLPVLFAAVLSLASAMPAHAARYFDFSFVGTPIVGDGTLGSGQLETDDGVLEDGVTIYTLTGITGEAGYDYAETLSPILGLFEFGGPLFIVEDADGGLRTDRLSFFVDGPLSGYTIFRPLSLGESALAGSTISGLIGSNGETFADVTLTLAPATISAVPEPAAWALMIGGFGLAGIGLRRRPRAVMALATA